MFDVVGDEMVFYGLGGVELMGFKVIWCVVLCEGSDVIEGKRCEKFKMDIVVGVVDELSFVMKS